MKIPDFAAEALSFPPVLRAAWLRVDGWYRSGNQAPQPELSRWMLHPEAELRNLAHEFRAEEWTPSPWPQVPYPKKGERLRHYFMPTVKDQVAFMAHMVLLGPLLDSRVACFAFGSRWYRPIRWDLRSRHPRWKHCAYPFVTNKVYLPYSRSHGLFRRVASWTVGRMTGARVGRHDYAGKVRHPSDYSSPFLPAWLQGGWWHHTGSGEGRRAWWAALDIELAFPSVRLARLRSGLLEMLGDRDEIEGELLSGYPRSTIELLVQSGVRDAIAHRLVDALETIDVALATNPEHRIPRDSWIPHHARPELPPRNKGLPTGLAISGLLLNVALHTADTKILQYLRSRRLGRRGAFVRFADDMYVLSQSSAGLFELIERVDGLISGEQGPCLDAPSAKSNLYLNLEKIKPQPIREIVMEFLKAHGWATCDQCDRCERLVPPKVREKPSSISRWLKGRELSKAGERASIGPQAVGPFVTVLVERMSEIGNENLAARFGQGAKENLVRLHDLARLDIADEQVRPDTRRAFAVNRLVRAWLLPAKDEARSAIADIRDSVSNVLRETPWKFALWRAVVRACARRPATTDLADDDRVARQWLLRQLECVAVNDSDSPNRSSWMHVWPEEHGRDGHLADESWRRLRDLYLSFHRATFWQALADTILALRRHYNRLSDPRPGDAGPPPGWWTVRAVPEPHLRAVARFLGNLDLWLECLYRSADSHDAAHPKTKLREWELDGLVAAVLACSKRSEVATAWQRCKPDKDLLAAPAALQRAGMSKTFKLLKRDGRLQPSGRHRRPLGMRALAHVRLAVPDSRLGEVLFPPDRPSCLLAPSEDPWTVSLVASALDCTASLSAEHALSAGTRDPARFARALRQDPLKLSEYERVRRIHLGRRDWE